jgi:branched-chain amino acid transport system ATP-binding protein
MLSIENLHSHYGLGHVIQGISLDVAPGEVVGVFGRNGVGKTTLLKNIAGWVKPTSGGDPRGRGRSDGGASPTRSTALALRLSPKTAGFFRV